MIELLTEEAYSELLPCDSGPAVKFCFLSLKFTDHTW